MCYVAKTTAITRKAATSQASTSRQISTMDDGYGSDEWGDIDYHDLIAAADEVELQATPPKPQQWDSSGTIFMDDDFDDFDEDDILYAAVPSIAVPVSPAPSPRKRQVKEEVFYPNLGSSTETLVLDGLAVKKEEKDNAPDELEIVKEEKHNAQPNSAQIAKPEGDGGVKKQLADSWHKRGDDRKVL